MTEPNIRNIAVIAHVDHGKTTLVDALLKQTHVFRENQAEMLQEQILDSGALERERGITIMAKQCSITYQGVKINIIDTPGHADFSGEVERTLSMADGALLIIDAQEGPMPQTRFVLRKALELKLKIIVVINKIDKKLARIDESVKRVGDLFLELATDESQLDFPVLYAVGRNGTTFNQRPDDSANQGDVKPLLDAILAFVPPPPNQVSGPFKMLVSSLDRDDHLGQIIIGRVHRGVAKSGMNFKSSLRPEKTWTSERIMTWQGLSRINADEVTAGDLVAISGAAGIKIGETIFDQADQTPLPVNPIGEPTIHITIGPNTSPFSGQEGKFTTGRQIGSRLNKELETNLSLRVEELPTGKFKVSGRGELHLSILLETLRREGYEMEVGKPEVVTKIIDNAEQEPVEEVDIIVPSQYTGVINQEMGKRLGNLVKMQPVVGTETEFFYHIPTRALIGLRNQLLTLTKGTLVINSQVLGFQPAGKPLPKFRSGAIISLTDGKSVAYSLKMIKGRGITFIQPGERVYQGMIIGQNSKENDMEVNVCKEKNLTNHRTKAHQGITDFAPDVKMSLEQSLDFLEPDELLEITPLSLRLRKKLLTDIDRRRNRR